MRKQATRRKLALLVALALAMALSAGCASRWTAPTSTPRTPVPTPTYSVPSSNTSPGSPSDRFNAIARLLQGQPQKGVGGSVTVDVSYDSPELFQALAETRATATRDAATIFADYQNQYKLGDNMVFSVSLNTHSGDLNSLKMDRLATLRDDTGRKVSAVGWEEDAGSSGHHRSGVLFFPQLDTSQSRYMELVLTNIAGVPERVFRWDLPIPYPGGAGS